MNIRISISSVLAAMFACGVAVADPLPTDVRIMDPAELMRLGFDPATDEVWRAAEFDDRQMLQERLARAELPQSGQSPSALDPLVDEIWTSVQSNDFHFRGASTVFTNSNKLELSCSPGSPVRIADAAIQFPNDHRVTWMDVWAVDSSTTAGLEVALYEVCQNVVDASLRSVVQLAVVDTGLATSPGAVFMNKHSGPNRWVRNATCSHMVRATWSSCAAGASVRLQKVRVLWDYD